MLESASTAQLRQVLDGIAKKRKRDEAYLKDATKRELRGKPGTPPSFAGRAVFVHGPICLPEGLARQFNLQRAAIQDRVLRFVLVRYDQLGIIIGN